MKCAVCKEKVGTTFLQKIVGTYVNIKGKRELVCPACQKAKGEAEIIKELS